MKGDTARLQAEPCEEDIFTGFGVSTLHSDVGACALSPLTSNLRLCTIVGSRDVSLPCVREFVDVVYVL